MKRPLYLFLFSIVVCLLLSACGGSSTSSGTPTANPSMTLNVFAAASLTESFNEIASTYHQMHPTITIKPVYNGSQILEQQIASGAPADVFASADTTNMQNGRERSGNWARRSPSPGIFRAPPRRPPSPSTSQPKAI